MQELNQLRQALGSHLQWHGARLTFLACFLTALFRVKTINLAELATVFPSKAQPSSSYKRLQRFFRGFEVEPEVMAPLVVALVAIPQPWTLSLDRTNWSFGVVHFNILMLAVVHEGTALPLLWTMLDKQGNRNSDERMDLMDRFEALFPQAKVACLTADREFIGQEWFSYLLLAPRIPFRIRIRHSDRISSISGKTRTTGARLFASLPPGQVRLLSGPRWVWGRRVRVVGSRLEDGQLLILVTNTTPNTALADYARRWGIETLFAALKTRGFCLESTHFIEADRLSKLVALLAIAFTWAMKAGLWIHRQRPIPLKAHGRRARSIFRTGLDFLRHLFCNLAFCSQDFHDSLQLLSRT